jgi:hypothetical protein
MMRTMAFEEEVRAFMRAMTCKMDALTVKTDALTVKTDALTVKTDGMMSTMAEHSRILFTMYAHRKTPELGCKLTGELLQNI